MSAPQVISSFATEVQVEWDTEGLDEGSYFDTSTHEWTPPAGHVILTAFVYIFNSTEPVAERLDVSIRKDGNLIAAGSAFVGSANQNIKASITAMDVTDGSAAYDVSVFLTSGFSAAQILHSTFSGFHGISFGAAGTPSGTGPTGPTGAAGAAGSTGATGPTGTGFTYNGNNSQTAGYTLVLTDAGKDITLSQIVASATVLTIPPNSSVAFPVGTFVFVNGTVNGTNVTARVAPGVGVTLRGGRTGGVGDSGSAVGVGGAGGATTHSYGFALWKVGTDTWIII